MIYSGRDTSLFIIKKMLEDFVYNMAKFEGNSLDFGETVTVMRGYSVSNKRMTELKQIEAIHEGWLEIIYQVENKTFNLSAENFIKINSIVSRGENKAIGDFRQLPVRISGTNYLPPLSILLKENFKKKIKKYNDSSDDLKIYNIFLETAKNQFFLDGNKRTGQLMMNGLLISEGYVPISIYEKDDKEFRTLLIDYYEEFDNDNKEKEFKKFLIKNQSEMEQGFGIEEKVEIEKER